MKKKDAILYFGTATKLGKAVGICRSAVSVWGEYPPQIRQIQIEKITGGFLKAEPGCIIEETPEQRKTRRKQYRNAQKQRK